MVVVQFQIASALCRCPSPSRAHDTTVLRKQRQESPHPLLRRVMHLPFLGGPSLPCAGPGGGRGPRRAGWQPVRGQDGRTPRQRTGERPEAGAAGVAPGGERPTGGGHFLPQRRATFGKRVSYSKFNSPGFPKNPIKTGIAHNS